MTPALRIVPEGWVLLVFTGSFAGLAALHHHWVSAALHLALAVFIAAYFYDSPRHSPARPLGLLAPSDGIVLLRRECHDPWLGREAIRIRIRLPWFFSYGWRAPLEGEVIALEGAPRNVSAIRADEGEIVVLMVRRGTLLGARPVWEAIGDRVGQGRRCGIKRLVRELEMLIPANSRIEVQEGQAIRCGETTLATLLRKPVP